MNLLPHLNSSTVIFDTATIDTAVYFFILSRTIIDESGTKLVSRFDVQSLPKEFKYLDPSVIKEALVSLSRSGAIKIRKSVGEIIVGIHSEGVYTLFSKAGSDDGSVSKYSDQLLSAARHFQEIAGGATLSLAHENVKHVERLVAKSLMMWNTTDFETLYKCAYTSLYQVEHRAFSGKERGQIIHFMKTYDMEVSFKMVIHYVFNSEKYHRTDMSLGLMMYNKDKIFAEVSSLSVEKSKIKKLNDKKAEDYFS